MKKGITNKATTKIGKGILFTRISKCESSEREGLTGKMVCVFVCQLQCNEAGSWSLYILLFLHFATAQSELFLCKRPKSDIASDISAASTRKSVASSFMKNSWVMCMCARVVSCLWLIDANLNIVILCARVCNRKETVLMKIRIINYYCII